MVLNIFKRQLSSTQQKDTNNLVSQNCKSSKSYFIIVMTYFKYYFCSLFASLALSILVTNNYNYSKVHEQALVSEPTFLQTRPIPNAQHKVYIPSLIESLQLRKYQLKDTNYQAQLQKLSAEDQYLLFKMDPPRHLFGQQSIFIDSYQLLESRKFTITVRNPSKKFRICVFDIVSDRTQVRRQDQRGILPLCLQSQESYNFNFAFYAAWLNPQYVQGAIYFFLQIYDGQTLAEEKVYARKILVSIKPNHLRIQTPVFRTCPRHNTIVIKNYEIFQIGITVEGKKKFETMEGTVLDGQIRIAPTKSIKILLQGKPTQMLIHTRVPPNEPALPSLFLQTICEEPVTLDYFNIGILPEEKSVFEFPLSLTSTRMDAVTLEEVVLQSTSQTVSFEEIPGFNGYIPPQSTNMQIGLLKILARKQPERKSIITIKLRITTVLDEFWTSQKFIYQEIRNPVSAGARRFIDLRKLESAPERFSLKNNLNIPIFITKLFYDQSVMQLTWVGERRKIVPPNRSIEELAFKYIGPRQIRLSPQKHILILEFNGNILVPIQIVLYDQTLQCLVENQAKKCSNVSQLDFGYFRDIKGKSKQIVIRNWNPQALSITLDIPTIQSKRHQLNLSLQIFGPLPNSQLYVNDQNQKNYFLKPNHFMVINIQVQPLYDATSADLPFVIITNQQTIRIKLLIKVQNGTIALIPQVVRFQNPVGRTIQYLNLVSTYPQNYQIVTVSSNLSSIIVAVPPHSQLRCNQFVGMTVVYNPANQENITEGDWSPQKIQSQYFLHRIKRQYQTVIFAQIKLMTSTQLEAKSTIIIEKNYKPLVFSSTNEEIDRGVRTMSFILTKRKPKSVRQNQAKQLYQLSIDILNSFPLNLKYRPFLVPQIKFIHLQNFFRMYRLSKQSIMQQIFFCVSEKLKTKTRMSVMHIRDIFNLQQIPDEYIMQIARPKAEKPVISMYTIKNQKNETIQIVKNTKTYYYLLKANQKQCKICYFFIHHQIVNRLILSQLLYTILLQEGQRTLKQFVRAQLQNLQSMTFFQNETINYVRTKQSYKQFCYQIQQYAIYRFCDAFNGKILNASTLDKKIIPQNNDHTYLIAPHAKHRINIQLMNPEDNSKFFLVLANNHSKFQTYQINLDIRDPNLYLSHGFISPQFSEIYDQAWGKSRGANFLPIELFLEDYHSQESFFQGTRIFQLINDGEGDLLIGHIGIDEKQRTCSQKGIIVYGLTCGQEYLQSSQSNKNAQLNPLAIKPKSKHKITIKFLLNLRFWPAGKKTLSLESKQSLRYMIYLYDQKGYYYKLQLIFRIGDSNLAETIDQYINPKSFHKMYRYFIFNLVSLLAVYLLLKQMREEDSHFQTKAKEVKQKSEQNHYLRMFKYQRITRIMKENRFENSDLIVGVRLNKKAVQRPIHKVSDDLVLSAKEVTQRDLKRYFNQSQESAIGALLQINHHLSLSQSMSEAGAQHGSQIQQIISQPSDKSSVKSSDLPEGEEVDLTDQIDEDSWYDFNREATNQSNNKSNKNINTYYYNEADQQEFYNVFRSDISLKKKNPSQLAGKIAKKKKQS